MTLKHTADMIASLNELTAKVTAFRSFAELAAKMLDGYVPTLRGDADSKALALGITRAGFKAWNPATGRNWVDENG
jgi:hypothetical protein